MITRSDSRKWLALGLLFLCHVYFFQIYRHFIFTNEKTRFLLVSAIVDDGEVSIDSALKRWGDSQDKSRVNGRLYCDKAIGTSMLGVPVYALLKAINNATGDRWSVDVYVLLLRIFCVSIPALLFLFPLARFWGDLNVNETQIPHFLFLFTFGTIVFINSSQYISHHIEGIFLFLSFYFAYLGKKEPGFSATRLALSGVFAGMGLITEYPAVFPVFAIFLYMLSIVPSRVKAGWFIAGALPFVLGALFYNYLIFGTPFDVTYRHQNDPTHVAQHSQGFVGLGLPNPAVMWNLLFSRARGIFFLSPFLLFAVPGFYFMIRNPTWRREGILFCAVIFSYYLFHSSISMWHAGWALGPRYLTAILPFLMTGVVFYFSAANASRSRYATATLVALGIFSLAAVTAGTITFPFPDQDVRDPVFMLFFPLLFANAGGYSLGNWFGLHGLGNALVFCVLLLMTYLVMIVPDGQLQMPSRKIRHRWILSVCAGILLLLAGHWSMPQMTAFEYYARGSNLFFVGLYRESIEDLKLALAQQPEGHMRDLILLRLRHISARQAKE